MEEVPEVLVVDNGERQTAFNDKVFHNSITYGFLTRMTEVIDPSLSFTEK